MKVTMLPMKGIDQFAEALDDWEENVVDRFENLFYEMTLRWLEGTRKRAPVLTTRLKELLHREVQVKETAGGYEIIGMVMSDEKYAPHVEFGTKWIAGGRVKALGIGPEITDEMAIHEWPARTFDSTSDPNEQMPFMRPAFWEISEWFESEMLKALNSP